MQESNILGAKGPRKMHVLLPRVYETGTREEVRPKTDEEVSRRCVQCGRMLEGTVL